MVGLKHRRGFNNQINIKMEDLKIKKEAALKAHKNAKPSIKKALEDLFGKKTFLKEITERIKTPEDAIAELGESDIAVIDYRKLLKAGVSDHILNGQLAVVIVKALNEGWEPNWDDSYEYKYFPWFYLSGGSSGFRFFDSDYWDTASYVGSRLWLKSSDLAKYAGEQFTEVYKNFMIIN